MSSYTKAQKTEARDMLLRAFPKGSTVYTITRNVSRSGMQRTLSVLALRPLTADSLTVLHPNWSAAVTCDYPLTTKGGHDGVIMRGVGYNHGAMIAETIGWSLYGHANALRHESL